MNLTAQDLDRFGVIDEIVPEPLGGHIECRALPLRRQGKLWGGIWIFWLASVRVFYVRSGMISLFRWVAFLRPSSVIVHIFGLPFPSAGGRGLRCCISVSQRVCDPVNIAYSSEFSFPTLLRMRKVC